MTTEITTTQQLIGLAAAGAAALGLSLSDGLLQPMGKLAAIRTLPRTGARRLRLSATPVPEETPEELAPAPTSTRAERRAARAAELERQRAVYAAPLTPATEPHSLRVEGYDPEFTPNPENFGQLS